MSIAFDTSDPFRLIGEIGIIPVIAINDVRHALLLADALLAGGLPVAEITFRTRAAADVIATLRAERPEMLVGAGTVLDAPSLVAARERGARVARGPGVAGGNGGGAAGGGLAGGTTASVNLMTPSELGGAL